MVRRLILILVLVALASALPSRTGSASKSDNDVYLALGDSLAVGVGATHPDQQGYVAHLDNTLRGEGNGGTDMLLNLAEPGETSSSLRWGGQLDAALAAIADPSTDVEVVTLDIGGNDLHDLLQEPSSPCVTRGPTSVECQRAVAMVLGAYAQNLSVILATLSQALALEDSEPETVLVMTYFNPLSGTGDPLEPVVDNVIRALNQIITSVGMAYGVTVVDVYSYFDGKAGALMAEFLHPNNAGHAIIASVFRRELR